MNRDYYEMEFDSKLCEDVDCMNQTFVLITEFIDREDIGRQF